MEVKWPAPSGKTERFSQLPIDKYITIAEGEGTQRTEPVKEIPSARIERSSHEGSCTG
jgi:hypothetical protein